MKKAVIFWGEHYTGKSHTINSRLKPLLKIKKKAWTFSVSSWHDGIIFSQSSEESPRSLDYRISKLSKYNFVVTPCRPPTEKGSHYHEIQNSLKQKGYEIVTFEITNNQYDGDRKLIAKQAYSHLHDNNENLTYLGFADDIFFTNDQAHIRFDSLKESDFLTYFFSNNNRSISENLQEIEPKQIELKCSQEKLSSKCASDILETNWCRIQFSISPSDTDSNFFGVDTTDTIEEVLVNKIEVLDPELELTARLQSIFSLDYVPHAERENILDVLSIEVGDYDSMIIHNVGQGSCATLEAKDQDVLFDAGGGIKANKKTYPNHRENLLCRSKGFVILSHWDMDHWVTGYLDKTLWNLTWIVPDQGPMGVTHRKLAQNIIDNGSLLKWKSASQEKIETTFIDLYKLKEDRNRNYSGLVAVFKSSDGTQILIPGDARYDRMNFLNDYQLSVIIVPHHGGFFKGDTPPIAPDLHLLAYSYGQGNSYKHPSTVTEKIHTSQGWESTLNTLNRDERIYPFCPKCTSCSKSECDRHLMQVLKYHC